MASGMSSAHAELSIESIRGSDVKKILRRIEIVVENQLEQKRDLELLKNQARHNGPTSHPTITEIQGLPLQTMAELELYETTLANEEHKRQLVSRKNLLYPLVLHISLNYSLPSGWNDILNRRQQF